MRLRRRHKPYGPIFWIHIFIETVFYLSWALFSWWIVLIGIALLQIQFLVFGGCVLAKAELGEGESFTAHYLHRWGLVKNKKITDVVTTYYMPIVGVLVVLVWQTLLGFEPLIY